MKEYIVAIKFTDGTLVSERIKVCGTSDMYLFLEPILKRHHNKTVDKLTITKIDE